MALGTTNISFNALNTEFERSATQQFSLDDTRLRAMAGGVSTDISFNSLKSKSGVCTLTISTAQSAQYNVATQAAAAGYAPSYQKLSVVVNSGIVVYGGNENASYPAAILFIGANLGGANNQPYGIYLTNNGTIVGQGRVGASGGYSYSIAGGGNWGEPATTGCMGVRVDNCSVNITNNGIISGGSGGGAGGQGGGGFYSGPWTGGAGGGGGAPYGPGGSGGAVQSGGTVGNSGATATWTTGGAGGAQYSNNGGGYAGGNQWAQNGGGLPVATYISLLNAGTPCAGYTTGAGYASGGSGGTITYSVVGTRYGNLQ